MIRRTAALLAIVLMALPLLGCSDNGGRPKLTIFAASSLTGTFTTLEARFERQHSDVDVALSLGSSTTLAQQVDAGAPADVIATADAASMDLVRKARQVAARPVRFATNTLVIAVPAGNPGDVTGLDSLRSASYVACDPSAPCGAAAQQVLDNASITAPPKTYEPDVATTLAQVSANEVDAGLVYVTDALAARDKVDSVPIPAAENVTNPYYIAAVKGSKQAVLARAWVRLVTSSAGRAVLHRAGFGLP